MDYCMADITRDNEERVLHLEVLASISKIRTKFADMRTELTEQSGSENAMALYLLKHEKICQKANEKLQLFEAHRSQQSVQCLYGYLIKQETFRTALVAEGLLEDSYRFLDRLANLCTTKADSPFKAQDNIHAYAKGDDEQRKKIEESFQYSVDVYANSLFERVM